MKEHKIETVATAIGNYRNDNRIPTKITMTPSFYEGIVHELKPQLAPIRYPEHPLTTLFGLPTIIDPNATEDVKIE